MLDVRTALEFEGEHIDGARNIPLEELEARLGEVPSDPEVLVICRTGIRAAIAAASMVREGRRVGVLDGGMQAWRRASLPVREGRRRLAVDRQVQLIAGTMVLAGMGLGTFVNPWFFILPAFIGAGLTFAGATGTCGLAHALAKMPWNRVGTTRTAPADAVCAVSGGVTGMCEAPGARAIASAVRGRAARSDVPGARL
jgi:rhodanese-related sulfurtransferase